MKKKIQIIQRIREMFMTQNIENIIPKYEATEAVQNEENILPKFEEIEQGIGIIFKRGDFKHFFGSVYSTYELMRLFNSKAIWDECFIHLRTYYESNVRYTLKQLPKDIMQYTIQDLKTGAILKEGTLFVNPIDEIKPIELWVIQYETKRGVKTFLSLPFLK